MFKEPFNFSLQRTPLQALGWYLFFFLLAAVLGGIAGAIVTNFGPGHPMTIADSFHAGAHAGRYISPIIPGLGCIFMLISRPLSALNVLIVVFSFAISLFLGWLGAGILLAYLTTRPPRTKAA